MQYPNKTSPLKAILFLLSAKRNQNGRGLQAKRGNEIVQTPTPTKNRKATTSETPLVQHKNRNRYNDKRRNRQWNKRKLNRWKLCSLKRGT
jgi:hypothetical protein